MQKLRINHFSFREFDDGYSVILVFEQISDSQYILHRLKEISEIYEEVRVMDSENDWDNYYNSLTLHIDEIDQNGLHKVGISTKYEKQPQTKVAPNPNAFIQYLEKFDKYSYRDHVEKNAITKAAINSLQNGPKDETEFLRILNTLNLFWL